MIPMTKEEVNEILLSCVKQDMNYACTDGSVVICNTSVNDIQLNFCNGLYQVFDIEGKALTTELNTKQMESWLVKTYTFK